MIIPRLETPWSDLIDIALVALLVYALIVWFRGARAYLALVGIGILAAIYMIARQLGLTLTAWIFQGFFAAFLLLLVVMFQGELRQVFERLAVLGLRRRRLFDGSDDAVDVLTRTAFQLAAQRHGALILLPGDDPIERHIEGGVTLGGQLSQPLLLSLFDPHSPGHDGAVVVDGRQVRSFAVHLPLSNDVAQLGMRGTRHAAALGVAERTDALCIVVSEERGRVAVAQTGRLDDVDQPAQLALRLRALLERGARSENGSAGRVLYVREHWREMALAVTMSLLLWVLVVPGSKITQRTVTIPVRVENLPDGYVLESVEPKEVEATISGLRRDLFFLNSGRVYVSLDAFLIKLGRRTFEITTDTIRRPPTLEVLQVQPQRARVVVAKTSPEKKPAESKENPG